MPRQISSLLSVLLDSLFSRRRLGVLGAPLGRAQDRDIDAALASRGLGRADLFRPGIRTAQHRRRFASMLAAHGVDPSEAVAAHWYALKAADHRCFFCDDVRRCEWWLSDEGRMDGPRWQLDAPRRFCPNAEFIGALAASGAGRSSDANGYARDLHSS